MKAETTQNLYINNKLFINKDIINFTKIKPSDIWSEAEFYLKEKQKVIDLVINNYEISFKELLLKLYACDEPLDNLHNLSEIMNKTKAKEGFDTVKHKIFKAMSNQTKLFYTNPICYSFFKESYKKRKSLGLTDEELSLFIYYYKKVTFSKKLSDKKHKQVTKIDIEILKIGSMFEKNILKSKDLKKVIVTDESVVKKIPKFYLDTAKKIAKKKGIPNSWIFQNEEQLVGLLEYSTCQKTREEAFIALGHVSHNDRHSNIKNIKNILSLSNKKAKIHGYKNYSDYILKYNNNMAKSSREVNSFLKKMKQEYLPKAMVELDLLKDFALKSDNLENFKASDAAHYRAKYMTEIDQVSEESFHRYFKLDNLMFAMQSLLSEKFDLVLKEQKHFHKSLPKIRTYKVFQRNKLLGVIYFDPYDRSNKDQGFYQCEFILGSETMRPQVLISGQISESNGLMFDDMVHIFHEFGHALSVILAKNRFCFTGTGSQSNMAMDFIEFPSQLFQLFIYEPKILQSISYNKRTKNQLTLPFIKQILKSRQAFESMDVMSNIWLSKLDMKIYSKDHNKQHIDLYSLEGKINRELSVYDHNDTESLIHSPQFGHCFDGVYGSQYYSYLWSMSLAKEIFGLLKETGFAKKAFTILQEEIYYPGSIRSEIQSLVAFKKRMKKEFITVK